ncbi:FHA domain-containing protein [Quadrisphaera setariae]|uniref:ATP-binding cassette domain-containing protein n=1 Tax=Quadrisphaera setariae TaxID=2593304 RepID=A0A5C8ZHF0_9ACTN|nr:ATP-binding cassette domain-containing protein [Quadrisphaera setariae]TXR56290.1 ATP-binding cassette domain-containing protein [Quadrisphaera setariae]
MVSAAPTRALLVRQDGRTWSEPSHAAVGRRLTVGRTAASDVPVDHPLVSRDHAVLELTDQGWLLTDLASRNGTYRRGERISRVLLEGEVEVRLGDPDTGPALQLLTAAPAAPKRAAAPASVAGPGLTAGAAAGLVDGLPADGSGDRWRWGASAVFRPPTAVHSPTTVVVRIGRATDNTIVVPDLLVSRHHAELVPDGSPGGTGYLVRDLGSANGTFVDGSPVPRGGSAVLPEGGLLSVGHTRFVLRGGDLHEHVDDGRVSFEARGLEVSAPVPGRDAPKGARRVLLDGVSFSLEERSLLAVVGPSGAGKSTLLGALTGFRPAQHGEVLYDGRDLYRDYADLRHRIGLVPQDDVLHTQLTVRTALTYAAQLRFPADTSADERAARVEEVIVELGLTAQADLAVEKLSGGQRKRTSVALELLTKPSLLFLDEPTSGLDPGLDKSVMRTLRGLADDGRTVVVVTHSTANLEVCDRVLLLAPGGSVAYFGPPQGLLEHFGLPDHSDVFLALSSSPRDADGRTWKERFRPHAEEVAPPTSAVPAVQAGADGAAGAAGGAWGAPPKRQPVWKQTAVLVRRYLAVIAADRQYVGLLVGLPLALAVLARIAPTPLGLLPPPLPGPGEVQRLNTETVTLLMILVLSGALVGAAASVREVVEERPIYRRERAIGLSPVAYLASKALVLGSVVVVQSVVLVVLALVGRDLPSSGVVLPWAFPEVVLAVAVVAVASACLGLAISAAATTADQAMPLMVLLVMAQLVFTGALFPVDGRFALEQLAWLVPARWGFNMAAGTVDLPALVPGMDLVDPLWATTPGEWWLALGMTVVVAAVALVAARLLLRRAEPSRHR